MSESERIELHPLAADAIADYSADLGASLLDSSRARARLERDPMVMPKHVHDAYESLRRITPRDANRELGQIIGGVLLGIFAPLLLGEFVKGDNANGFVAATYLVACACSVTVIVWCTIRRI